MGAADVAIASRLCMAQSCRTEALVTRQANCHSERKETAPGMAVPQPRETARADNPEPSHLSEMPVVEGRDRTAAFQGSGGDNEAVEANHFAWGLRSCPQARVFECGRLGIRKNRQLFENGLRL